ncbi:hypothetical protein BC937DRAFT_88621 [Endogone sp. FLAS-F59071]|nr:hypothetical protein BC937DRAFT_88621 [Endogone sp. FLAS-F59071]|eukprot:RUS18562.1 hypothetical protein BC937DRAFT_88621 [Endogone sp. FLAS-F59071]
MTDHLDAFLLDTQSRLQQALTEKAGSEDAGAGVEQIVVAIGNESAEKKRKNLIPRSVHNIPNPDLDSVISALAFSFLSHTLDSTPSTLHLPLANIPSSELHLRPELLHVLTACRLTPKNLLFAPSIIPLLNPNNTTLILVDHNRLTPPLASSPAWTACIAGILDHHSDERLYHPPLRVIEPVGSATSLVARHFQSAWSTLDPQPAWSPYLARLMLAPILVDTVNLQPQHGRTTETDTTVAAFLTPLVRAADPAFTEDYYASIQHARTRLEHLSTSDLLRKDYKEWTTENGFRVGISSVALSLEAWAEREGGATEVVKRAEAFAKEEERSLDLEVVMTGFDHGGDRGFERELVVVIVEDKLRTAVMAEVEGGKGGKGGKALELEQWEQGVQGTYRQRNVKMSRKQVWPLVKEWVEKV